MSASEQVSKLEALLERVNTRRNAPRTTAAAAAPAAHDDVIARVEATPTAVNPIVPKPAPSTPKLPDAVAAKPAAAAVPAPAPTPKPAPVAVATPAPAPVAPVAAAKPAAPAIAKAALTPEPPSVDVDVVVEEGVAEVDLEGLDEEGSDVSLRDSVADLDAVAGGSSAAEDDPAASSRRPIQVQPAAGATALADAAEAKAPHPAPPESGRQVAIPPASGEDELLKSGVRAAPVAPPEAAAAPAPLRADVTRPALAAESPAVFHGAAPIAAPATFGELLEATLSL